MPTNKIRGENAKIVATLGPGSRSRKEIRALAEAGVDVFRLNFSHGEHDAHREALEAVRAAEAAIGQPLATLADLQGPKVRVGRFPGGAMRLGFRAEYELVAAEETDREGVIPVPHAEIVAMLEIGDTILVDDGKLILTVTQGGDHPRVKSEGAGADRQGSQRSRFCARDRRRYRRLVICPDSRRYSGSQGDHRGSGSARREAGKACGHYKPDRHR
mgnify:CR=1 FL=1